MTVLEELQQATERALDRAGPAVVRIGRGSGRGAGFVFGDGVVVTNAHNLRGAADDGELRRWSLGDR